MVGQGIILRRKLDLLLRTGKISVESAADTNCVVRNMNRVAAHLRLPEGNLHVDMTYTVLAMNLNDEPHSYSKLQKCEKRGINMMTTSEISKLSWRATEEDYSLDRYEEELKKMKNKKRNYTPYLVAVRVGFACGGFCKLSGGDRAALLSAFIAASVGFHVHACRAEFNISPYMNTAIVALVSVCLVCAITFTGVSGTSYHPLLACTLFIVPGVPIINLVDDMIDSYIQIGIVHAVNTVLVMCAIAFGIVIAMRLLAMEDVVIDKKFSELSMAPYDLYYIYAIAVATPAMGFSMTFSTQRHLLWVVTVGGITAVCIRNFVNFELGFGPVIGFFTGIIVVSLVTVRAVHWFHVPNHVLTTPSATPITLGVLMYCALVALINMHGVVGEVTVAASSGINASLIAPCVVLGMAILNVFARRYVAKDRRRFLWEESQKCRERGNFLEW